MLKVDNAEVFNFFGALRGMRNPMNSWSRGDSYLADCDSCPQAIDNCNGDCFVIGENDLDLCKRLIKGGTEHRKFLRQVMVSVDITAPLYWWKEFDTYKVGTTANSTSTMHKIHVKEFEPCDFSFDDDSILFHDGMVNTMLSELNRLRDMFNETKKKEYWRAIIQLLPSGYNQTRTVTLNYEILMNMHHQRRHHKLSEWHTLCDWIEEQPYMKEFLEVIK